MKAPTVAYVTGLGHTSRILDSDENIAEPLPTGGAVCQYLWFGFSLSLCPSVSCLSPSISASFHPSYCLSLLYSSLSISLSLSLTVKHTSQHFGQYLSFSRAVCRLGAAPASSCLLSPPLPALSAAGAQAGWTPSPGFESLKPVGQLGNWAHRKQSSVLRMLVERPATTPSCYPGTLSLLTKAGRGGCWGEPRDHGYDSSYDLRPSSVPCWSLEQKATRGRVCKLMGLEAWGLVQSPLREESFKVAISQS